MTDALSKLQAGADKARAKLAAHRLGGRERDVAIRCVTKTGGNPALGIAPTRTAEDTVLEPRPVVKDASARQYLFAHGGRIQEGDLLVSAISRSYAEAQLRGADAWVVDGVEYALVLLAAKPTEYEVHLRRA